jgi:hypothetical protein
MPLFQLQQVEIVLQNALHSQKGEITIRLREHMRMRITYFGAKKHFGSQSTKHFLDLRNNLQLLTPVGEGLIRRRRTTIQVS